MNTENRLANKDLLYVYDQYNVRSYSTHPIKPMRIDEPLARLVNALIHGLNENRGHLPKTIMITPDWDIVKGLIEVKYGVGEILEGIIEWVIDKADKAIQKRKDDLKKQKGGAITCIMSQTFFG